MMFSLHSHAQRVENITQQEVIFSQGVRAHFLGVSGQLTAHFPEKDSLKVWTPAAVCAG